MSGKIHIDVSVNGKQFTAEMDSAGNAVDRFGARVEKNAKHVDKLGNEIHGADAKLGRFVKGLSETEKGHKRVATEMGKVGHHSNEMSGKVSMLSGTILAMTGIIGVAITGVLALNGAMDTYKGYEILSASLKTVTGSVENASIAFSILEDIAANTPFTLDQSVKGFQKLVELGLTPSEEALLSYGNTASAMGKDMMDMVEAVADATTGEFERLKEFGIKANAEGDRVSLTFQGMTTQIGNNAADIEKYLINIGKTEFATAMADQMDTINGHLSNLSDNYARLERVFIQQTGLADVYKNVIKSLSGGIKELADVIDSGFAEDWLSIQFGAWIDLFERVENKVSEVYDNLYALYTFVYGEGAATSFLESIGDFLLDLPLYAEYAFVLLSEVAKQELDYIATEFVVFQTKAGQTWDSITYTGDMMWLALKMGGAEVVDYILGQFAEMISGIANALSDLPFAEELAAQAANAAQSIQSMGTNTDAVMGEMAAATQGYNDSLQQNNALIDSVRAQHERYAEASDKRLDQSKQARDAAIEERKVQLELNAAFHDAESQFRALDKANTSLIDTVKKRTSAGGQSAAMSQAQKKAASEQEKAIKQLENAIEAETQALKLERIELTQGSAARYAEELRIKGITGAIAEKLITDRAENEAIKEKNEAIKAATDIRQAAADALQEQKNRLEILAIREREGIQASEAHALVINQKYVPAMAKAITAEKASADAKEEMIEQQEAAAESLKKLIKQQELQTIELTQGVDAAKEAKLVAEGYSEAQAELAVSTENSMETQKAFADALYDSIRNADSVKDVFSNLGDYLMDWLKDMIAKFAANKIMVMVSGATGGMALPGMANASDGLGSLFSGATGGQSAMGYGVAAAGGNLMGSYVGELFGGQGSTGGEIGGTLGATIGMAIGGPLGAAVGSVAGSIWGGIVGGMFRGDKETKDAGIALEYGSGGFSGQQYEDWFQDGGWLHSDRRGTNFSALDDRIGNTINDYFDDVESRLVDQAEYFGFESAQGFIDSFETGMVKLSGNDDIEAKINEWADDIRDQMYTGVFEDSFAHLQLEGEVLGDTLDRLILEIQTVEQATHGLGLEFSLTALEAANAADAITQAVGGVQNFATLADLYYANFYSDQERLQNIVNDSLGTIALFNEAEGLAIGSKQELRDYIDGLDLTSEAGQNAFAAALELAPALVALSSAQDELGTSTDALLTKALSLRDAMQTIELGNLSTLAPVQKLETVRENFNTTYAAAQAGDQTALDSVATQAQQLLQLSQAYNASGSAYQTDYHYVMTALDELATQFENQIKAEGSHAAGLAYVPHDGYRAELHQGESVIDARTMLSLRQYGIPVSGGQQNMVEVVTELKALRAEVVGLKKQQHSHASRAESQRRTQIEVAADTQQSLNISHRAIERQQRASNYS